MVDKKHLGDTLPGHADIGTDEFEYRKEERLELKREYGDLTEKIKLAGDLVDQVEKGRVALLKQMGDLINNRSVSKEARYETLRSMVQILRGIKEDIDTLAKDAKKIAADVNVLEVHGDSEDLRAKAEVDGETRKDQMAQLLDQAETCLQWLLKEKNWSLKVVGSSLQIVEGKKIVRDSAIEQAVDFRGKKAVDIQDLGFGSSSLKERVIQIRQALRSLYPKFVEAGLASETPVQETEKREKKTPESLAGGTVQAPEFLGTANGGDVPEVGSTSPRLEREDVEREPVYGNDDLTPEVFFAYSNDEQLKILTALKLATTMTVAKKLYAVMELHRTQQAEGGVDRAMKGDIEAYGKVHVKNVRSELARALRAKKDLPEESEAEREGAKKQIGSMRSELYNLVFDAPKAVAEHALTALAHTSSRKFLACETRLRFLHNNSSSEEDRKFFGELLLFVEKIKRETQEREAARAQGASEAGDGVTSVSGNGTQPEGQVEQPVEDRSREGESTDLITELEPGAFARKFTYEQKIVLQELQKKVDSGAISQKDAFHILQKLFFAARFTTRDINHELRESYIECGKAIISDLKTHAEALLKKGDMARKTPSNTRGDLEAFQKIKDDLRQLSLVVNPPDIAEAAVSVLGNIGTVADMQDILEGLRIAKEDKDQKSALGVKNIERIAVHVHTEKMRMQQTPPVLRQEVKTFFDQEGWRYARDAQGTLSLMDEGFARVSEEDVLSMARQYWVSVTREGKDIRNIGMSLEAFLDHVKRELGPQTPAQVLLATVPVPGVSMESTAALTTGTPELSAAEAEPVALSIENIHHLCFDLETAHETLADRKRIVDSLVALKNNNQDMVKAWQANAQKKIDGIDSLIPGGLILDPSPEHNALLVEYATQRMPYESQQSALQVIALLQKKNKIDVLKNVADALYAGKESPEVSPLWNEVAKHLGIEDDAPAKTVAPKTETPENAKVQPLSSPRATTAPASALPEESQSRTSRFVKKVGRLFGRIRHPFGGAKESDKSVVHASAETLPQNDAVDAESVKANLRVLFAGGTLPESRGAFTSGQSPKKAGVTPAKKRVVEKPTSIAGEQSQVSRSIEVQPSPETSRPVAKKLSRAKRQLAPMLLRGTLALGAVGLASGGVAYRKEIGAALSFSKKNSAEAEKTGAPKAHTELHIPSLFSQVASDDETLQQGLSEINRVWNQTERIVAEEDTFPPDLIQGIINGYGAKVDDAIQKAGLRHDRYRGVILADLVVSAEERIAEEKRNLGSTDLKVITDAVLKDTDHVQDWIKKNIDEFKVLEQLEQGDGMPPAFMIMAKNLRYLPKINGGVGAEADAFLDTYKPGASQKETLRAMAEHMIGVGKKEREKRLFFDEAKRHAFKQLALLTTGKLP